MKQILVLVCCLSVWVVNGGDVAVAESGPGETLSPYFFITGDDSAKDLFPLKQTDVEVAITGVIADVTVKQVYTNRGSRAINGRYIFPASTRAAVHGMKMVIGERVIRARIKEKEAARQEFSAAQKKGKQASLLEQQRPNVFSMDVANIMPGDTVMIELRYTELLVPESGTYEFVYPTVVGPRYSSSPDISLNKAERWVKNPYLKKESDPGTGFTISVSLSAGMKLQELSCPTHETTVSYQDESRARIQLSEADLFGGDRDYILRYRLADMVISSGLILEKGEKENFFLLMAQPPERLHKNMVPPREYTFVIDVSGSMNGFPLDTAKKLLEELVGGLSPDDYFNVLFFAGGSKVMSEKPVPATPENVRQALKMIDESSGGGGTELLKAMKQAMSMESRQGVSRTMVVVTDGYIHAEKEVFTEIQKNLSNTNVFAFGIGSSVNRYLIEGIARSGLGESFVVTSQKEAGSTAEKFREYISSPVLTDINLRFNDIEVYDVEPPAVPDLFAERPIIVFGKWKEGQKGSIELSGRNGEGTFRQSFRLEDMVGESSQGLSYLWARSRIGRISDYSHKKGDPEEKQQIVELGLAYNLLTAFTSFVAVDEIIRNPDGQADQLKQPLPLPKGVSELAVGTAMNSVPEPDVTFLVLLFLSTPILAYLIKRKSTIIRWKRGQK